MRRIHFQTDQPVPFYFRQSRADFVVDEVPVERSAGKGSHLIVRISKVDLSTMEMLKVLEQALRCHSIGFAGLKDKSSTSTQYLSVPARYEDALKAFSHPKIKVIESFRYHQKVSMGDLRGNRFFIRLKEVSPQSADTMRRRLDGIMRFGMPNYFGYQRFGRERGNLETTREIAHGEKVMRDKKMQRLLGHAYQSHLFNDWLAERVALSRKLHKEHNRESMRKYGLDETQMQQLERQPNLFRVLPGDILLDKQTEKWLNVTDLQDIRKGYKEQRLIPTGLLAGRKVWRARAVAGAIEAKYDDMMVVASGDRREAWVYPKEIRSDYRKKEAFFELSFFLPKGAYATVLLENLANRDLG